MGVDCKKVLAALFYGVSSFMITVVNKVVLTSFGFPSYQLLGVGQILFIVIGVTIAKVFRFVSFPNFDRSLPRKLWPLPLVYLGNVVFGLGGTKKLSLPMLVVLRRFSILFTMIGECWILGKKATCNVQLCVYLMIFGAVVAASNDLGFDLTGYVFVFLNDLFTAANGIYTKQILDAKELGELGLLYYNSLLVMVPMIIIAMCTEDLEQIAKFSGWTNPAFLMFFLLSCVMGFLLMYSIIVCTKQNSALTTTVVGVLKNLLVTYLGIFIGGDYVFSWVNFIGLNISAVGSLFYSYITFRVGKPSAPKSPVAVSTVLEPTTCADKVLTNAAAASFENKENILKMYGDRSAS